MPTAVLRVDPPSEDGGFPVSLTEWTSTSGPPAASEPLAQGAIPAALDAPQLGVPDGVPVGEAIRRLLVAADDPASEDVRAVATWLHALLDEAGVGTELRRLRDAVPREARPGEGLRLYLDIRAEEVRHLPWELVFDGDRRWPFGELANPAARIARHYADADPPPDWYWPLRVLVVVARAANEQTAHVEREIMKLRDEIVRKCAEVDVEVLRRPEREDLLERLVQWRPHILHVIGHAETSAGGEQQLVMELDDDTPPWCWRASHIDADLERVPRVVVLNCCPTHVPADQHAAWHMADAFAERGVPAVITMQGPIEARDGIAFGSALYRTLTAPGPTSIDVAVTAGRRAITTKPDGWDRREMCFPALILNRPPDKVVPPRWLPGPHIRERVQQLEAANRPTLLDRRRYRRDLLAQLDLGTADELDDALPPRLITITGPESVGKSALARWVIARQMQRGRQAAYVQLGDLHHGWHEVLRKLCNEVSRVVAEDRRVALSTFLQALEERAEAARARAGEQADEANGASAVFDHDELIEIADAAVRALRTTAGNDTLIIALDPLDLGETGPAAPVIPEVVSRVDAGDANDTRLLLVRRATSGDPPPPRDFSRLFSLTVDPFDTDPDEVQSMWRQYLVVRYEDDDRVESLLPHVAGIPVEDGAPDILLDLFRAIERTAARRA